MFTKSYERSKACWVVLKKKFLNTFRAFQKDPEMVFFVFFKDFLIRKKPCRKIKRSKVQAYPPPTPFLG